MPSSGAVCIDLYSTLIHENLANPFYRKVSERLSLPMDTSAYGRPIW
jgi:hypothetical protein